MPWTGGEWLLFGAAALIFLGVAHRVLDRMRLTRRTALILLLVLAAGPFLPDLPLGRGVSVNPGGFLVPLGVAVYLVTTADQAVERRRAVAAALLTGAVLFTMDQVLPLEPGEAPPLLDVDPVWAPAILAAVFGYAAGRSRRSAFVAGTAGVLVADLLAVGFNLGQGVVGALAAIGAGGAFDAIALGGILAVALVEAFGETRERLARRARRRRPERSPEGGPAWPPPKGPSRGAQPAGEGLLSGGSLRAPAAGFVALVAMGALLGPRLGAAPDELPDGRWMSLVDETGAVLLETGRRIFIGDEWIDTQNIRWVVTAVDGLEAVARRQGVVDLLAQTEEPGGAEDPFGRILRELLPAPGDEAPPDAPAPVPAPAPGGPQPAPPGRLPAVAVFHTHNAESYVPTDGRSSIVPRGGIHAVGRALVRALETEGFTVHWSQASHLPHDRGAYRRSRRTVARLLRDRPAILVDVHRDAAPPQFYRTEVDGRELVGIRFVIGRQNPARQVNLGFVKRLKAVADDITPGLVKGIFIGRGNYNQDVGPRSILIEVGAHTNDRIKAEQGAALFAKVLREYAERARLAGAD